jgi:hypothetical protein
MIHSGGRRGTECRTRSRAIRIAPPVVTPWSDTMPDIDYIVGPPCQPAAEITELTTLLSVVGDARPRSARG